MTVVNELFSGSRADDLQQQAFRIVTSYNPPSSGETQGSEPMFDTTDGVIRALRSLGRSSDTRSTSILSRSGNGYAVDGDPFHGGFIDSLEARTELLKRFACLDERERALLTLWYVQDLAVPSLCETLGMSRATAYRIRDRALERLAGINTPELADALA